MNNKNVCQFFIIVGEKNFKPLNDGNVYINATGVKDFNLINTAIYREFNKKKSLNVMVNNEIIFLIPNSEFEDRCKEIMNALGIRGRIEFISMKEENKLTSNIKKAETNLMNDRNISASGSENIEVQKDTGIEKITISNNKAYVNSGLLSIDEQKYSLLQEWKKDPYMNNKLASLSAEEIDRLLMESVTKNLTTYRMESSREQIVNDKVGEVAKDKAFMEDGLVNTELGVVRNNVNSFNKYSTVEERDGNARVVNPNISNSTISSGGITSKASVGDSYKNIDSSIMREDIQTRELGNQFYLDDDYNVYNDKGDVIGRVGQKGISVDYNTNTLVMNGKLMGDVGDYKDMGKNTAMDKKNVNTRTLKKEDKQSNSGFVSLPVVMFVLSGMLLIGSLILLFVLK